MRLAPAVEGALPGIVVHPNGPRLMNNLAADRHGVHAVRGKLLRLRLASHRFDDRGERVVHVTDLVNLMVRPAEMEPQHRDAPLVDRAGVNLAVRMCVGNHLAAAGKADPGAVLFADSGFQRCAIPILPMETAYLRHIETAADLDMVPARKILLLVI